VPTPCRSAAMSASAAQGYRSFDESSVRPIPPVRGPGARDGARERAGALGGRIGSTHHRFTKARDAIDSYGLRIISDDIDPEGGLSSSSDPYSQSSTVPDGTIDRGSHQLRQSTN